MAEVARRDVPVLPIAHILGRLLPSYLRHDLGRIMKATDETEIVVDTSLSDPRANRETASSSANEEPGTLPRPFHKDGVSAHYRGNVASVSCGPLWRLGFKLLGPLHV